MPGSESHDGSRKPRSMSQDHGFVASFQRFWQKYYASDYLGLALLLAAYIILQFFVDPFHRMFSLDDKRIQYPHAEVERVPVTWLFVYAASVPAAVLLGWAALVRPEIHKIHVTMLGFGISLILTSFVTDANDTPLHQLVTFEVCTEADHHVLHDGWRSFPSGHSSFAFSGLGYLGFFFTSQLHVVRPRADLARVLIAAAPFLAAMLIAVSRLEDYRHDVFDVVVGSSLGLALAYFNWRRYYPALSSRNCATPHPSPVEGNPVAFSRIRDEEEGLRNAEEFELSDEDAHFSLDSKMPVLASQWQLMAVRYQAFCMAVKVAARAQPMPFGEVRCCAK
ncbi:hypothetical protein M8818_001267 [Zalaria obscura]|uniref:Uncharacterized protein n=1 Tax=Zalaria obscura TaxID=2024903 RepID=A0ACC3SL58_9PEZI